MRFWRDRREKVRNKLSELFSILNTVGTSSEKKLQMALAQRHAAFNTVLSLN